MVNSEGCDHSNRMKESIKLAASYPTCPLSVGGATRLQMDVLWFSFAPSLGCSPSVKLRALRMVHVFLIGAVASAFRSASC